MMELRSGFKITLFSHPDYENLTAEVYFGELFIALVFQTNDSHWIELSNTSDILGQKFDLIAFIEAVNEARSRLNS
jgi:hypothetical protein